MECLFEGECENTVTLAAALVEQAGAYFAVTFPQLHEYQAIIHGGYGEVPKLVDEYTQLWVLSDLQMLREILLIALQQVVDLFIIDLEEGA